MNETKTHRVYVQDKLFNRFARLKFSVGIYSNALES